MSGESPAIAGRNRQGGALLVSSASRKAPLIAAVQRACRNFDPSLQVITGDLDPHALARYLGDDFWAMPPTSDEHLPAILAGCRERSIRFILPTRDGELAFWAHHAPAFADAGILVIVSCPAAVALCLDKLAFARFGRANGFPFIPASENPGEFGDGPLVVKERYGAGSRKIGLNLDRQTALDHARSLDHPIFQPFVEGCEISIDAWVDRRHRVNGIVLRRRDSVSNGESQITTTFRNTAIAGQASRVLAALRVRGPVVLQAIVTGGVEIRILECNPRFGGASTAGIAAGLDPFYWSLLEAEGAHVSPYPFDRISGEVRQVRVPMDLHFYDPDL
ncbi:MAG: ATP-grasp domain-containing protein [Acidobacteriia bacterium]|nr:ATP-grasp domain-containing protein [Terriglobia bacterium]